MELLIFLLFIAFVVWTINKMDKNKSTTKNNPETTNPKKLVLPIISESRNPDQIIKDYFNKNNIRYWLSEDKKSFRTGFDLDNEGSFEIFINIHNTHISFVCDIVNHIENYEIEKTLEIISRINQYYNFGQINFFFESRIVAFKLGYPFYENILNEDKFGMYFNGVLDGARNCRPIIKKVLVEGEEPAIAVMNI